ncbi:MAG TPA: dTDP-4-dehydrorhamnose 3,5-epimerase [Magnetovibrio sp.]
MGIEQLSLPGLMLFETPRFADGRGAFSETFNANRLKQSGIEVSFVQDNFASSDRAGTLRGLHFQRPPHAQAKLVRVIRGRIWDVAVDLRQGSPTFGKWQGVELSAQNWNQLYVPVGFAHGYVTLEDMTEVFYKVSDFYAPECEGGVVWNDPNLGIAWPLSDSVPCLSEKDERLPQLEDIRPPFVYGAADAAEKRS